MKGDSDMNSKNDKKIKGKKVDVKKPIQVLHISKKESEREQEENLDDNQNIDKRVEKNTKVMKPQVSEIPLNEDKENYSTN